MPELLTMQDLANGHLDVKALGEAANGDENTIVTTRTGNTYPSAERAINIMFQNGGLPATPFATKALMEASALVDGDYAMVTDDTDNNGLYVKTAGAWVKSAYDPMAQAKVEIDKIDSLTVNKNSLYPLIYKKRGSAAYLSEINTIEKNILSITVNNALPDTYYRLSYLVHAPNDPTNAVDARNNGWQFSSISKADYDAGVAAETVLTLVREPNAKYRIIPNSGIVTFTIYTDGSDLSFTVTVDTTGLTSDFIYIGTNPATAANQHIIDPVFYQLKDSRNSLTINKGKLYPFIVRKRGTYNIKGALTLIEKNILSIAVNNALPNTFYRISYMDHAPDRLPVDNGLNGWQIRSIDKSVYDTSNTAGTVLTDIFQTKFQIVPNTGIVSFSLQIPNSDLSFDIVLDTAGFEGNHVHARNRDFLAGFDHIIDPSTYRYKATAPVETPNTVNDFLRNEIFSSPPIFDALSYGVLPISSGGTPDFNNIISGHNLNQAIAPASLTKLLTAILALESTLTLNSTLTVKPSDIWTGELKSGDVITLKDALHYLLLPSNNTAAILIGRTVGELNGGNYATFITMMNAKAATLGMTNSEFKNAHGLENAEQYSCVADMFRLGYAASQLKTIRDIWATRHYIVTITGANARTFNAFSSFLTVGSNYWCLGGKTGTNTGVYNILLHVQLKNGYRGIAVTMGGSGDAARIKDITNLVNYARNNYSYPAPSVVSLN